MKRLLTLVRRLLVTHLVAWTAVVVYTLAKYGYIQYGLGTYGAVTLLIVLIDLNIIHRLAAVQPGNKWVRTFRKYWWGAWWSELREDATSYKQLVSERADLGTAIAERAKHFGYLLAQMQRFLDEEDYLGALSLVREANTRALEQQKRLRAKVNKLQPRIAAVGLDPFEFLRHVIEKNLPSPELYLVELEGQKQLIHHAEEYHCGKEVRSLVKAGQVNAAHRLVAGAKDILDRVTRLRNVQLKTDLIHLIESNLLEDARVALAEAEQRAALDRQIDAMETQIKVLKPHYQAELLGRIAQLREMPRDNREQRRALAKEIHSLTQAIERAQANGRH